MSVAQLGEPLSGVYSVPGGEARLYERGVTVNGAAGEVVVPFAFPMIGRPSIAAGTAAPTVPFQPDAIQFRLGNWPLAPLTSLIQHALSGRVALLPTGRAASHVPVTSGPSVLVSPEQRLEVGDIVIPAVYGISVSTAELRDRELYDVGLRSDDGRWRIVAPHAVYAKRTWSNFGIAAVNDLHVARRIDGFRALLTSVGRVEAAQRMFNWNDRFRGFVRYANYLHGIGVLDAILAVGDLVDYGFEDDDDPAGGGNYEFLRKLILGQAPGPEFPETEELMCPMFMVPGNHDYRRHPYKLMFDLNWGVDLSRIKNFAGYHLLQHDALALANALDGRPGDSPVLNLGPEASARMVEVDPDISAYKRFLADRTSYVVPLGRHRVAMLDSAHDVGMVTSPVDALRLWLGRVTEDELTFVGGSPNSEGVSAEDLAMVSDALNAAPDGGLFIVGVHAPLCNLWNDESAYYLRETQRAAQPSRTSEFLARHGGQVSSGAPIETQMKDRYPLWFPAALDPNDPAFVKRENSQDFLDAGVSRGAADDLTKRLAGIGSRRPGDVVLSGHTHYHNEFSIRKVFTGEIAYHLDFYTQNPARYYPTRFATSWKTSLATSPPTLVPVTDVTAVEVTPGAAPDANPWATPFDDKSRNQLQIPPYGNPLNAEPDPSAWWAGHRPLLLQTAAYAPLKVLDDFSGFRVLLVKRDVIEKIHFVPTGRLEENDYRLAWEGAIRPAPYRRYRHVERSRPVGGPKAVGVPAGIAASGVTKVAYRDGDGRIHELWRHGSESGINNLTDLGDNAIRAAGNPTAFLSAVNGPEVVLYRATDSHVHSLYWLDGTVRRDALSLTAGAPAAAGNPVGLVQKDGTTLVIYRAGDRHLHGLAWTETNAPHTEDLMPAGAPPVDGDPTAFVNNGGENIVVYRGIDREIHGLHWLGIGAVTHETLSSAAGSPKAAGDPVGYYMTHNDTHLVTYRSHDGHLHELSWVGDARVTGRDLTAAAGARPADRDPIACYSAATNTCHVIYRSPDGHLNEIWFRAGGVPTWVDLTVEALAPLAEDRPAAFVAADGRHAVYRGPDGHIHEIRWPHESGAGTVSLRSFLTATGLDSARGIRRPMTEAHVSTVREFVAS